MRALLVMALTLALAPSAVAATVLVDDSDVVNDGAAPYVCGGAANKCLTIQHGIDHATAGDTISVAPGSYTTELVGVNKSVVLRGAKAGVDARTRTVIAAQESVVTGPAGKTAFSVSANGVTIDGFVVQGNTDAVTLGAGIFTTPNTVGLLIENNVIQNNIAGVIFGADHAVFTHNLFKDNNISGTLTGTAIYTDHNKAGNSLFDLRVIENDFVDNQNVGVLLGSTDATKPADDVVIDGNSFPTGGNAMLLLNTSNAEVTDNDVGATVGSGIVVGGGVSQADFSGNTFTGTSTRGFRVGDIGGGSANSVLSFTGNTISGRTAAGLEIEAPYTGAPVVRANRFAGNTAGISTTLVNLTATYNWWGCDGGPGATGCDPITGTGAATAVTSPRTVLSLSASPSSIPAAGGVSTITATLSKANDGSAFDNGVPEGTPVTLSTTLGSLPASASTSAGIATAQLTAGAGFGSATVTATLDNQSTTTTVAVKAGDSDGDGRSDDVDCAPADATKPAAGAVADANCDGTADPAAVPPADKTAPLLSQLRILKGRLKYTSSERALVQIVVKRKKRKKFVRAAATAMLAKKGANSIKLPGKPKHNRARVTITATDAAGNKAKAVTLKV